MLRAEVEAELGDWEAARSDFEHALPGAHLQPEIFHRLALLRLRLGDRQGADAICRLAFRRLEGTSSPERALWLARTCALDDLQDEDRASTVVELGRLALSVLPESALALETLGLALLRVERPGDAGTRFEEAEAQGGPQFSFVGKAALGPTRSADHTGATEAAQFDSAGLVARVKDVAWFRRLEFEIWNSLRR